MTYTKHQSLILAIKLSDINSIQRIFSRSENIQNEFSMIDVLIAMCTNTSLEVAKTILMIPNLNNFAIIGNQLLKETLCICDNLSITQYLQEKYSCFNLWQSEGKLLHTAIQHNAKDIMHYMLEKDKNISEKNWLEALYYCIKKDDADTLSWMLIKRPPTKRPSAISTGLNNLDALFYEASDSGAFKIISFFLHEQNYQVSPTVWKWLNGSNSFAKIHTETLNMIEKRDLKHTLNEKLMPKNTQKYRKI